MYKFFECWLARKFYLGSVGIKSPAMSCWGGFCQAAVGGGGPRPPSPAYSSVSELPASG